MGKESTVAPKESIFFNDTATTEIYTLSLHDALPISGPAVECRQGLAQAVQLGRCGGRRPRAEDAVGRPREPDGGCLAQRSEEHTSELQSRQYLVCRLLLEKKQEQLLRVHGQTGAGRE